MRAFELRAGHELLARLSPGATVAEAQRELDGIARSSEVEGWLEGRRLGVRPLKEEIVGDSAHALELLLAAVAVVLAIACANLAQLLLARSDRRLNEFATRKAVGAGSSRLFRMALLESLLWSAAGGVGAVVLAHWMLPAMLALAPTEIPRIAESAINGRVLLAAVLLTVATGCLFGMAPALRLSRTSVMQAMKRGPGTLTAQKTWFHSALVAGQIASSVALCVLAGLIGRSYAALLPIEPGFEPASRTVLHLVLPTDRYPEPRDRAGRWDELVRRVAELPGIVAAGFGTNIPFGHDDGFRSITGANDSEAGDNAERLQADLRAISPNFFRLLQMPLVEGRVFTSADGPNSAGVAIVNQTLARKLAPQGRVLGRTVKLGGSAALPRYQIVGVVSDARSSGSSAEIWDEVYIPQTQSTASIGYVIVESEIAPSVLDRMLREEIRAWAPELPETPWLTATRIDDLMSRALAGPRFSAVLSGAFSTMALLLAATGVFGLVAYSVSQRYREFGIRAALGARPRDLLVTTVRSAAAVTALGVGAGLAMTIYLVRFIKSFLYAIEPLDVPTFLGAAAVMLVAAGLAAYLPARRAARADPMATLRYE